jgi:Inner membrane component of T3SS, cytoplasmic domain
MDPRGDDERPVRLAVIEILDRDGHARQLVPVWHWPVTIGRAIECDVVLDDPHVAARHATVSDQDGQLDLQVGDTINGVQVGKTRVRSGKRSPLPPGEAFQLGGTRLRVRRASDPVTPERALAVEPANSRRSLFVLALALVAWSLGEQWLNTDPGARFTDYLPVLVGSPALLGLWCFVWALGSKLFRHRFEFFAHARVAVTYLLIAAAAGLILPLVAYALSWAFPSRIASLVGGAVIWAMVFKHLSIIMPSHRRVTAVAMGIVFVGSVVVMMARSFQVNDRLFPELYVTTLAPPAFRVAPTVTTDRFLEESRKLKAALDAHANDDDGNADDWFDD